MPTYEYHCPANDQLVTVVHRMVEDLYTWGELCARANIDPGSTALEAPVAKKIGLSTLTRSSNMGCDTGPPIDNAPAMSGPFVNPNAW